MRSEQGHNHEIRSTDALQRDFAGKKVRSACYAPYVSLFFTTLGDVQACCRNETFVLGNVRTQRLGEIWNGGRLKSLRKALDSYNFDLGCQYCEWEARIAGGTTAFRSLFDPFPVLSAEPEWPAVIDFVGSNTCNFECVMCWGELSSSIRANRHGLPPLPKAYDDRFFEDLRPFLRHLKWMNFLGGEPFLTSEAHRIWQMMIEDGVQIPCHVTTNGSQFNEKVQRVLNALPVSLTVSLDGVTKETFESIRHRSNFETVIANLNRLHAYTRERGTSFKIAFCLMRQNWHEFGSLLLFADRLDCDVQVNAVIEPSHCSLYTLPPDHLRSVADALQRQSAKLAGGLGRNLAVWEETVDKLRAASADAESQKLDGVLRLNLLRDDALTAAERLASHGEYEKALRRLNELSAGHANDYFARVLTGRIRTLQGELDEAGQALEGALQITRKLPHAYLNLARLRVRQDKLQEAHQAATHAQALVTAEDPLEAELLSLLVFICLRRFRFAAAWRALRRLAEIPPSARRSGLEPDSQASALRLVSEVSSSPGGLRARILAGLMSFGFQRAAARPQASRGDVQEPLAAGGVSPIERLMLAADPMLPWSLRVGIGNKARLVYPPSEAEPLRVVLEHVAAGPAYEIQLNYRNLSVDKAQSYTIRFRARSDEPRGIAWGIAKAGPPWTNLGLYRNLQLSAAWQEFEEEFLSSESDDNVRVHFDLGGGTSSVELQSFAWTAAPARSSRLLEKAK